MKLGILCTMINGFGRRGYYNSQEVGLGRALAAMGHEVTIYKGIDPSEEEEKVVAVPGQRRSPTCGSPAAAAISIIASSPRRAYAAADFSPSAFVTVISTRCAPMA